MQTKITKKIDFSNSIFYIGLDVHKKNWHVTILTDNMQLQAFTQPPSARVLADYMHRNYPGGTYYSAYEAGFCGYGSHRQLIELGIQNIVVNPADIPRNNKELVYQTDKSDSRSIARELRSGHLRAIHVFDPSDEEFRALFRHRLRIAKDIRRTSNRIKQFLFYRSIQLPPEFDNANWSGKFLDWLKDLQLSYPQAQLILHQIVDTYHYQHNEKLMVESQLRAKAKEKDPELFRMLQTIPGIGPLTAVALMSELGDISRFKHIKHLASFVGLIPRISQSGQHEGIGEITYRHNAYLRPLLVEAAWQAVRADPLMLQYYQNGCVRATGKKVIIKVARKLLSKIMFVMKNRQCYQKNFC